MQSFSFPSGHELNDHYVKHLARESRPADGALDLGAYEFVGQDLYVESLGQCGQRSPCLALVSDALAYATGGEVVKVPGGAYAENVEIGKDVIVEFGLNAAFSTESPFDPAILRNPVRAEGL